MYQQFRNKKTLNENFPPNIIVELKPYNSVHMDLIGPYRNSIRQQHPDEAIINKCVSLT